MVNYNCDFCHKECRTTDYHFNNKKTHFCSRKCYGLSLTGSNVNNAGRPKILSDEQTTIRLAARWKLQNSLQKNMIKKHPCKVCGSEKVEGHHHDYYKPLEVTWYCKKHHLEIHGAKKFKSL